jgi:quinol monooxygenase YgiN
MYARSTTIRGVPQALDEGARWVRDEVLPVLQEMDGFVGLSMLGERETGRSIITSAWRDEESMRASEPRMHPMRQRFQQTFGGELEVEEWEIAVLHRARQTGDGAAAAVVRTRTDPGRVDQALDVFRRDVMPKLEERPGFCSLSLMVNRQSGRMWGVTAYENREVLERVRQEAERARQAAAPGMGVEVLEVAEMELLLAHLRVPETV